MLPCIKQKLEVIVHKFHTHTVWTSVQWLNQTTWKEPSHAKSVLTKIVIQYLFLQCKDEDLKYKAAVMAF